MSLAPPRIGISACLLGVPVRYDGRGAEVDSQLLDCWRREGRLMPVCPECLGGLPTPRPPAERQGDAVRTAAGGDQTAEFRAGAATAVDMLVAGGAVAVILKSRGPSCGLGQIYDGSFTGRLTDGDGLFAEAARAAGLALFRDDQIAQAALWLENLNHDPA